MRPEVTSERHARAHARAPWAVVPLAWLVGVVRLVPWRHVDASVRRNRHRSLKSCESGSEGAGWPRAPSQALNRASLVTSGRAVASRSRPNSPAATQVAPRVLGPRRPPASARHLQSP
eukprot:5243950-Prymnesium_polylepis.1